MTHRLMSNDNEFVLLQDKIKKLEIERDNLKTASNSSISTVGSASGSLPQRSQMMTATGCTAQVVAPCW